MLEVNDQNTMMELLFCKSNLLNNLFKRIPSVPPDVAVLTIVLIEKKAD